MQALLIDIMYFGMAVNLLFLITHSVEMNLNHMKSLLLVCKIQKNAFETVYEILFPFLINT